MLHVTLSHSIQVAEESQSQQSSPYGNWPLSGRVQSESLKRAPVGNLGGYQSNSPSSVDCLLLLEPLACQDLPGSLSPPLSSPPSSTSENGLASLPSARFLPDGCFQWESWPMWSLSCSAFLPKSLIPKSFSLW